MNWKREQEEILKKLPWGQWRSIAFWVEWWSLNLQLTHNTHQSTKVTMIKSKIKPTTTIGTVQIFSSAPPVFCCLMPKSSGITWSHVWSLRKRKNSPISRFACPAELLLTLVISLNFPNFCWPARLSTGIVLFSWCFKMIRCQVRRRICSQNARVSCREPSTQITPATQKSHSITSWQSMTSKLSKLSYDIFIAGSLYQHD